MGDSAALARRRAMASAQGMLSRRTSVRPRNSAGGRAAPTPRQATATAAQVRASGRYRLRWRTSWRLPASSRTAPRRRPRCAEGPQTFVHNDFRLDNIFFRPDGQPVIIDWQLAGRCRGTQDLAYLLSGSMATDAL